MRESVVPIRREYLDNFWGESKGSTGWLNLYHEFFKKKLYTWTGLLLNLFEKEIEVQYIEPYKAFAVPFDNNKLNLLYSIIQ